MFRFLSYKDKFCFVAFLTKVVTINCFKYKVSHPSILRKYLLLLFFVRKVPLSTISIKVSLFPLKTFEFLCILEKLL